MVASSNSLPLQARLSFKKVIIPTVAGCIMIGASLLPWLNGPLGESYSAWQLPIDIGWQFRIAIINYGLLCLCCAIYAFVVAYAHWKPFTLSCSYSPLPSAISLYRRSWNRSSSSTKDADAFDTAALRLHRCSTAHPSESIPRGCFDIRGATRTFS